MKNKERIVVIGAGFGGLSFCKNIDKGKYDVLIVDSNNYNSFPPLFYQLASGALEPASITFPIRKELRSRKMRGCRYELGSVKTIDIRSRRITTDLDTIDYDKLVIAAGSTNNFFGIPDLHKHVYTLKSVSEAISCRNGLLMNLEKASVERSADRRRQLLTFVVIGGGPTGVEIAGALGEMKRYVVPREYPDISPDEVKVIMIEGSDRLLRTMDKRSSDSALRALRRLMVDVRLGKTMASYDDNGLVTLDDGDVIECGSLIWTAGITAVPFEFKGADLAFGSGNRIMVDEYNRVIGTDNVYAIGDISCHTDVTWPRGCPQLAQVAIQQGRRLARNLNDPSRRTPFVYNDKGTMATIGRNRAVVNIGKTHYGGWFAWITWMAVHLISLLGMRNKLMVLLNWTWSYLSFSSSLRLLIRPSAQPSPPGMTSGRHAEA